MNIIERFLDDFKNHYLSNTFQYGNNVYAACISDMYEYARGYSLPSCDNMYLCAELIDATQKEFLEEYYGIKLSYYVDGLLNRPTKVKKVNNRWYVSAYNSPIRIFDENQSQVGDVPAQYHNSNVGYNYVMSFDVDLNNNILYIVCYARHVVQAYDFTSGAHLFTIGDQGNAGDVQGGRLFNPVDVKVLSNGHVLVVCTSGRGFKDGQNGAPNGHITEYDNTGNLISSRLMMLTNGDAQSGEVYQPNSIYVDEAHDEIFVCYTRRGYVGRFQLSTWTYKEVYTTPNAIADIIVQASPRTCLVKRETNELLVTNSNPDMIASVDLDTHDLNYYIGHTVWNDRQDQKNIIGGFYELYHMDFYDSTSLIVCDYGNNCVQVVPFRPYFEFKYNFTVPEGYKIVDNYISLTNLNVTNKSLTVALDEIYNVPNCLYIPLEKI